MEASTSATSSIRTRKAKQPDNALASIGKGKQSAKRRIDSLLQDLEEKALANSRKTAAGGGKKAKGGGRKAAAAPAMPSEEEFAAIQAKMFKKK